MFRVRYLIIRPGVKPMCPHPPVCYGVCLFFSSSLTWGNTAAFGASVLLLCRLVCLYVFGLVLFRSIFDATADLCWLVLHRPTERERTECLIKAKLRNIMTFQDLENITSKEVGLTKSLSDFSYLFLVAARVPVGSFCFVTLPLTVWLLLILQISCMLPLRW